MKPNILISPINGSDTVLPLKVRQYTVAEDLVCLCEDHSMPTLMACRNGA